MKRLRQFAFVLATAGCTGFAAEVAAPQRAFIEQHCFECHDAETKKGGLDLTALKPDFQQPEVFAEWVKIHDRVRDGEMPPKKKARPPEAESKALLAVLDANLREASAAQQAREGRALARRLNRDEYQNTLRDLLGVENDYRSLVPGDGTALGFDKVGSALNISAEHLQAYLAAAEAALNEAIVTRPAPVGVAETFPQRLKDIYPGFKLVRPDKAALYGEALDDAVVFVGREEMVTGFFAREPGRYRLRVRARAHHSDGPVAARLRYGDRKQWERLGRWLVGYEDFPPEGREVEFVVRLRQNETLTLTPLATLSGEPGEAGYKDFTAAYPGKIHKGPALAIEWVKAEGPLHESWPPPGHQRLFGDLDFARATRADAERVLRAFLPRAFRRPVAAAEVERTLRLYDSVAAADGFLNGMKVALQAALCSTEFLYLRAPAGPLDDDALAARLSYFLWSSMPDDALTALAAKRTLHEPEVLRAQVERLLADPKAAAFTESFTGQWLDLRNINATTPDARLYPEWDELLEWSSAQETRRFFDELLTHDLSLANFVQSDFAMLNGRLALHYSLLENYGRALAAAEKGSTSAVSGSVMKTSFMKVKLPPDSPRGGVLAQASVLKVTANGTTSSPVLRGHWVMDRILDKPAPPPPAGVPAVEPDIRGATTIREQLAKHRTDANCAACHAKIDPPGFALESFDVIGGWRDRYRAEADHASRHAELALPLTFDVAAFRRDPALRGPMKAKVGIGPAVDASGEMPGGRAFQDYLEFRRTLLADKNQLARALAAKLATYATGAGLQYADRAAVEEIVRRVRERNYGFRTLVHEVIASPLFLNQ